MIKVVMMGVHLIIELFGVDGRKISKIKPVKKVLDRAVSKSGLKKVFSKFYQFKPFGVSAIYLLRESHLSAHTWPEKNYVALDIFTCGKSNGAEKAFNLIVEGFEPKKIIKKKIVRKFA